jgi:hypothetical protein
LPADLLIYLGVLAALWGMYWIRKHRRQRGKPQLGDADAYDGNLIIPPVPTRHGTHGSGHIPRDAGHIGHGGGHIGPGDGGAGHH